MQKGFASEDFKTLKTMKPKNFKIETFETKTSKMKTLKTKLLIIYCFIHGGRMKGPSH